MKAMGKDIFVRVVSGVLIILIVFMIGKIIGCALLAAYGSKKLFFNN